MAVGKPVALAGTGVFGIVFSTKNVYDQQIAWNTTGVNAFRLWQTKVVELNPISPAQSRAARGLIEWSQTELASRSNLSESTVRDFEKGRRLPSTNNLAAIQRALESAGVIFVAENGDGPGVRLRKS